MTKPLPITGSNIRLYRKVRGWTQTELAQRAGMTPGQISNLERVIGHPSVWTLARIAEAIGPLTVNDMIVTAEDARREVCDRIMEAILLSRSSRS